MSKPFTPEQAKKAKEDSLPTGVFEAVNELLAEEYTGQGSVTFRQDEVISRIMEKTGCSRADVFNKKYLDFEPHYRRAGWSVDYDSPAYNESYPASYTFRKKNGKG